MKDPQLADERATTFLSEMVGNVPNLAYSFATHSKVCTFSSQKDCILLGRTVCK